MFGLLLVPDIPTDQCVDLVRTIYTGTLFIWILQTGCGLGTMMYEGCSFCNVRGPVIRKLFKPVVKTCIRRNFEIYPITQRKIVLTSSAMWLFDVIKYVMLSAVHEKKMKKKKIPKPSKTNKAKIIVTFLTEQNI